MYPKTGRQEIHIPVGNLCGTGYLTTCNTR
jgi:hypothetical protein